MARVEEHVVLNRLKSPAAQGTPFLCLLLQFLSLCIVETFDFAEKSLDVLPVLMQVSVEICKLLRKRVHGLVKVQILPVLL